MSRILIVTTSHTAIPDTDERTGVWFEELAAPYYTFVDAGHDVVIASIRGGEVPIDGRSLAEKPLPASVRRFHDDATALEAAHHSRAVGEVDASGFDALFLPGGHGTMWDFPGNADLCGLITTMLGVGRVVAAVCHGPAALVGTNGKDGTPLVRGRRIACFTDSEERAVHLDDKVPFLLESRLRELGADVAAGPDFAPNIIADGTLLTGQNPKSSTALAEAVIQALKQQPQRAA